MRKAKILELGMWLLAASSITLGACADPVEGVEEEPGAPREAALIASQPLANGHTLLVYDFGESALFGELGDPRTPSSLDPRLAATEPPTQTWARLVPEQPAPAALIALTKRIQARDAVDPEAAAALRAERLAALDEVRSEPSEPTAPKPPSQKGTCGNICCDFQAMAASPFCKPVAGEARPNKSWFEFSVPGTGKDIKDAFLIHVATCSIATTRVKMSHMGASFDITIQAGQGLEWSPFSGLKSGRFVYSATVLGGNVTSCGKVWTGRSI